MNVTQPFLYKLKASKKNVQIKKIQCRICGTHGICVLWDLKRGHLTQPGSFEKGKEGSQVGKVSWRDGAAQMESFNEPK